MTTSYPEEPPELYPRMLDADLQLLDRQVQDVASVPVAAVADIELTGLDFGVIAPGTPPPEITALLSGPVLATRIFGGRPPASRLHRIEWSSVFDVGVLIKLSVKGETLDATWTERWVRDHIVARLPGGRHDPH